MDFDFLLLVVLYKYLKGIIIIVKKRNSAVEAAICF